MLDMLDGLKGRDVEPLVLIRRAGPLKDELEARGIRYQIIPYKNTLQATSTLRGIAKKALNRLAVPRIRKCLRDNGIELLHNNDMMCRLGAEAALLEGIPYICHLRDMVQEDHRRSFENEAREKEILNKAAGVVCISEYVHKKFSSWMPEQQNVIIVHNGVNAAHYLIPGKKILAGKTAALSIVGRISENKKQLEAVKAMDILQNDRGIAGITLKAVGLLPTERDAGYVKSIQDFAEEKHLEGVSLVPFSKDVIELQQDVDIGLMCSDHEAMGRSTIESMLAGNVTIGARAGATPELVEDGRTGLLYESGSPEDLADKIEYVMKHPEEAREIALRGQEYALKNFDIRAYGAKIEEVYRNILKKGQ